VKIVRCTQCKEVSDFKNWKETHEDCELCGGHVWQLCPLCDDEDEGMASEIYEWEDEYVELKLKLERGG